MSTIHNEPLQRVIAAIQQRWGPDALLPLGSSKRRPSFSTGFSALDDLLGGGLPRGALTQLMGEPTSGLTTLALRALASAQQQNVPALYVDAGRTLDPAYAACCGIDVAQVLVVWPDGSAPGLDIVRDVIGIGGQGIIVLDLGLPASRLPHDRRQIDGLLRHLTVALPRTGWTLLCAAPCLADGLAQTFAQYASLCLEVERTAWQRARRDIIGCTAQVTVLKHPAVPPGRATTLALSFDVTKDS